MSKHFTFIYSSVYFFPIFFPHKELWKCIYQLKFSGEDVYVQIYKNIHREHVVYFTFASCL